MNVTGICVIIYTGILRRGCPQRHMPEAADTNRNQKTFLVHAMPMMNQMQKQKNLTCKDCL